jgi:CheY-like chemotaxis protein
VNQKMMMMLLKKLGYSIAVAENGVEALKHLAQQTARGREYEVEVILMDASMAVMDGLECTRVIRSQQLPHRTRPYIVAQTANVNEEFRARCLESGMDGFSECTAPWRWSGDVALFCRSSGSSLCFSVQFPSPSSWSSS